MEHLSDTHSQAHAEKALTKFYNTFMNMPEWKQMAITGGVILFLIITGGGAYALMGGNQSAPQEVPKITNVEVTSNTPTPTVSPEEESTPSPSVKPSASPTATPKPTASPTPKSSTTPTPTPNSNKTYVLNWSTGTVNTRVHQPNEGYGVYALLKYDGATVTDQKNVKYTWTIADSSIADLTPFAACIDGIKDPCPEGHASIKAKKEGSTTITAKATWKDTGAFIDDVTITLNVSGGVATPTPTPSPTPTASPTPSPSPTTSPTASPSPTP